ncbi:MAG: TonB-dependent receptor plug domain-containing protein [Lewinella sp.]
MRLLSLCLVPAMFLLNSCTTQKSATTIAQNLENKVAAEKNDVNSVEVDAASGIDLTSYLRQIAGMQVRGSGPTAMVRVRDSRSAQADTTPLFVVNGTILGNNFSQLYSSIDPNEIARIRVLKTASETNRYGLQGGNGVIEIKLKD